MKYVWSFIALVVAYLTYGKLKSQKQMQDLKTKVWKKGLEDAQNIDHKSLDDLIRDANERFGL